MFSGQDRSCEQGGIDRPGGADGNSAYGNPRRHLGDGMYRILSLKRIRLHGHTQYRSYGKRCDRAGKRRGKARARDENLRARRFRLANEIRQQLRGSVRRQHPADREYTKRCQGFMGAFHGIPVRLASHHYSH